MSRRVTSNYKPRRLMAWTEIPERERPELDFGADPDVPGQYFEAYGRWWKLDDFTKIPEGKIDGWDFETVEHLDSAIVIKCGPEDEWVVAGMARA